MLKRRKYFINRRMQGRFILRFVAASLFGGLVAVAVFILLANRRIDSVLYAMTLPKTTAGNLLAKEMFMATLIAVCAVLVALWFTTRGLFSRINGPLTKLAVDLRRIGRGDLHDSVTLRRGDDFHEFADEVNMMTAELRGRFSRIRDAAAEMQAVAGGAATTGDEGALRQCRARLMELDEAIGSFRS